MLGMDTAIETATAPTTFSVLSFVEETAYPEDSVKIYTDVVSAKKLVKISSELLDVTDSDTEEALVAEAEKLEKSLEDSALTFELRGYAPGIVDALLKDKASEENPDGADADLIAKAIIRVTNSEGAADEHLWTPEEIITLKGNIADGEYAKLLTAIANVLFNAAVFSKVVDAGFLSGRTDMAAELSDGVSSTDSV